METIVALATPAAKGAISIIRMSGARAKELLCACFSPFSGEDMPHAKLELGIIQAGDISDKVLCVMFYAPKSYTGEDVCEVHCHGSPEIAARIVSHFISLGAREAAAGEFTRRAFEAGKISLDEAESVCDLINAQSAEQINAALSGVLGRVSGEVGEIYSGLLATISALDAAIDYPEEDVEEETADSVRAAIGSAFDRLERLEQSYHDGEKIRTGVRVAIVGKPNVGKSSLLNRLLMRDRAIVTDTPGTTRDTIEETFEYKGVLFTLIDTAGLREASDEAEREGVLRSEAAARSADVVLRVFDPLLSSEPMSTATDGIIIDVASKLDLFPCRSTNYGANDGIVDDIGGSANDSASGTSSGQISISSKTGEGIEELKERLYAAVFGKGILGGGTRIVSARHYGLVCRAKEEVRLAMSCLKSAPPEIPLSALKNALHYLGEITGATASEDIITEIFSRFCVGK